jgi:phospholipid-binding lipoprotein MlaA
MSELSTRAVTIVRVLALCAVAVLATGCATAPGRTTNNDPYEHFNRKVDKFNDTIDRAALKPVAKAYKKVTPRFVRTGVANFFANLGYPTTIVNDFLQGKFAMGLRDTGRLLMNTTFGIGGLIDVASKADLPANDEDFGQTLAVWGVPSGPYLVLPFFGPSNFRDGPSRIPDIYTDGLHYLDIKAYERWGLRGVNLVSDRAELLNAEQTLNSAYDRYAFLRDAWVQRRQFAVFDGNPPNDDLTEGLEDPEAEGDAGGSATDGTPASSGAATQEMDQPPPPEPEMEGEPAPPTQ